VLTASTRATRDGFTDSGKRDVPTSRSIRVTRWDFTAAGMSRIQRNRTHPTFRHPHLPAAAAQPLNVACFDADLAESLVLTGLAPRRTTVGAVQQVAHRLGENRAAPAAARRLDFHKNRA
jgi:hypothetical protein